MLLRFNTIPIFAVLCVIFIIFSSFYLRATTPWSNSRSSIGKAYATLTKQRPTKETLRTLSLNEAQCVAAFPDLTKEIDQAVARGPFELKKGPKGDRGSVQGMIRDGKLYILSAGQDNVLKRIGAILHSLHRAIITSPTPLPNAIFILNIHDEPRANTWSFARSDSEDSPENVWLVPHFSSWSWPLQYVGPLDEALAKIAKIERQTSWKQKINRAVWRGTSWFNPDWNLGLRPTLVEIADGKEWADVETWTEGQKNTIAIQDFCRYRYIIYTEGKTYSGRLPYHQACESIILTPPPTFLLHTHNLMRPLFSSHLLSATIALNEDGEPEPSTPPPTSYPLPSTNISWPLSYPPSLANVIFVQPDWSDLESVILYLENNPEIGEGIARRQRDDFVEKGYLSEAAEGCYWRSLIRAWSQMARTEDEEWEWEYGMRWETFSLLGNTSYK